jgi:hypothetical protein
MGALDNLPGGRSRCSIRIRGGSLAAFGGGSRVLSIRISEASMPWPPSVQSAVRCSRSLVLFLQRTEQEWRQHWRLPLRSGVRKHSPSCLSAKKANESRVGRKEKKEHASKNGDAEAVLVPLVNIERLGSLERLFAWAASVFWRDERRKGFQRGKALTCSTFFARAEKTFLPVFIRQACKIM